MHEESGRTVPNDECSSTSSVNSVSEWWWQTCHRRATRAQSPGQSQSQRRCSGWCQSQDSSQAIYACLQRKTRRKYTRKFQLLCAERPAKSKFFRCPKIPKILGIDQGVRQGPQYPFPEVRLSTSSVKGTRFFLYNSWIERVGAVRFSTPYPVIESRQLERRFTPLTAHGDCSATTTWTPLTCTAEAALKKRLQQSPRRADTSNLLQAEVVPEAWLMNGAKNHRPNSRMRPKEPSLVVSQPGIRLNVTRRYSRIFEAPPKEWPNSLKIAAATYDPECTAVALSNHGDSSIERCYTRILSTSRSLGVLQ